MKAAIIYKKGDTPQYAEVPEPVVKNENEILIVVKAAAIRHIDKSKASGKHYSAAGSTENATIPGGDGVGMLADGTRVFALGITGMIAEKAVIEKSRMIPVPQGLDDATAAALPNAVAGSAMALRFRAGMQPGDTVLINGATGFTGKIAVQVAKKYGAKRIIVTGRNADTLKSLQSLGADETISLKQTDEQITAQLKAVYNLTPVDIVIDYLWGHSAELILSSLKGTGSFTKKLKHVSVGSVSGDAIRLSSEILRSTNLQLSGSGLGSWTKEEMQQLFADIIPEMYALAATNQLTADTETVRLTDIERLWDMDVADGKRLVVIM